MGWFGWREQPTFGRAVGSGLLLVVLAVATLQEKGVHYPQYASIPVTNFTCDERIQGYYADMEAGCQVYHMCNHRHRKTSFLCPNHTLFHQRLMICDHWYMVNCTMSGHYYSANLLLGATGSRFITEDEVISRTSVAPPQPSKDHVAEQKTVDSQRGQQSNSGKDQQRTLQKDRQRNQENSQHRNEQINLQSKTTEKEITRVKKNDEFLVSRPTPTTPSKPETTDAAAAQPTVAITGSSTSNRPSLATVPTVTGLLSNGIEVVTTNPASVSSKEKPGDTTRPTRTGSVFPTQTSHAGKLEFELGHTDQKFPFIEVPFRSVTASNTASTSVSQDKLSSKQSGISSTTAAPYVVTTNKLASLLVTSTHPGQTTTQMPSVLTTTHMSPGEITTQTSPVLNTGTLSPVKTTTLMSPLTDMRQFFFILMNDTEPLTPPQPAPLLRPEIGPIFFSFREMGDKDVWVPGDNPQDTQENLNRLSHKTHSAHRYNLTMKFRNELEDHRRYDGLALNPNCTHCHPGFLVKGSCHPCVRVY